MSTSTSSVPSFLRTRLLAVALAAGGAGFGAASIATNTVDSPSPELLLAMELGAYYEGVRFTPYQDAGVSVHSRAFLTHT